MLVDVKATTLACVLSATTVLALGAGETGSTEQCDAARFAEVEFLVGEWIVHSVEPGTPPRERSGVATLSPILGGCAFQEVLHLDDGYQELRILAFDESAGTWQLGLVDNGHGNILLLRGHRVRDGLEFITTHQRSSALLIDRVSIRRMEGGWLMRIESADGYSEPWRLIQELRYTRRDER